jgi:hypothetical protein
VSSTPVTSSQAATTSPKIYRPRIFPNVRPVVSLACPRTGQVTLDADVDTPPSANNTKLAPRLKVNEATACLNRMIAGCGPMITKSVIGMRARGLHEGPGNSLKKQPAHGEFPRGCAGLTQLLAGVEVTPVAIPTGAQ